MGEHPGGTIAVLVLCSVMLAGCGTDTSPEVPVLNWYVFDEPSGAFREAAQRCSELHDDAFRIMVSPLPVDADQQREQLARRLSAHDPDIDLIGMDVIWTAEFAEAGWVLPLPEDLATPLRDSRLETTLAGATWGDRLQAVPFTTNAQLLWYRGDRVAETPRTWEQILDIAGVQSQRGALQVQGARYEGLTVLFTSLLASAGGHVLDADGTGVALEEEPTRRALTLMRRLATSPAADPALATAREDDNRRAFESGAPLFMVNYTYVWPSAAQHAPEVAAAMRWSRWPAADEGLPSRVTIGGIHLAVGAHTRHPQAAFAAVTCLASEPMQRLAARVGGLPPTIAALYDDPEVRATFPFADELRDTLRDAVQRPQTPLYTDVSLAIAHTLHPMRDIHPDRDIARLRAAVERALRSEGLI